jgi:hypothetical protein
MDQAVGGRISQSAPFPKPTQTSPERRILNRTFIRRINQLRRNAEGGLNPSNHPEMDGSIA